VQQLLKIKHWKYDEDKFLAEIETYLKGTYGEHYEGSNFMDEVYEEGDIEAFCRQTSKKYITRYGKKEGYNKKDIMKSIHYLLFLLFYTKDQTNKKTKPNAEEFSEKDFSTLKTMLNDDPEDWGKLPKATQDNNVKSRKYMEDIT